MSYNVLVIGGGGREHAICWKLSHSQQVAKIFVVPGSYGIGLLPKVVKNAVAAKVDDFSSICDLCRKERVELVIVGPEDPLANGLADHLRSAGILCFGPDAKGAKIEADKNWSKEFMVKHGIPTARFKSFSDAKLAKEYIESADHAALVVKASGLAAGKGVVVAESKAEAIEAANEMLVGNKFGSAGATIVIEEKISGEEVSVLAFVDGKSIHVMPPAQDHKRLGDDDKGPNTGGMGAYCPCPLISTAQMDIVIEQVLKRAVSGLQSDGISYCGVLYAGIMLTEDGPKTLEFNCRFGDPETQVILPLLKSDLYEIAKACCEGKLNDLKIEWEQNISAVGVIMASRGYPETSTKGCTITGIKPLHEDATEMVFHSGVSFSSNSEFQTNGGRVLIAVAKSTDLKEAAEKATDMCQNSIKFDGSQFRTDIAQKAIRKLCVEIADSSRKREFITKIQPFLQSKLCDQPGIIRLKGNAGIGKTYEDPVLVQGVDGVGTKLKIAETLNDYSTIGIDLVAMCANDVLCVGAKPVAFLDYIACGRLNVDRGLEIIKGISNGCAESGCALVGGETVEAPDIYEDDKYDLGGYCLGLVEHSKILPRMNEMQVGDIVVGLPSSGLHSNGFSLVNKVMKELGISFNDKAPFSANNKSFGEEFLTPTKLYSDALIPLFEIGNIKGLAHITGGGLFENIPRALPEHLSAEIDANLFEIPKMFGWLCARSNLPDFEALRTFNCGLGMVVILSEGDNASVEHLKSHGGNVIGKLVTNKTTRVIVRNAAVRLGQLKSEFMSETSVNLTYKTSGVDITAGDDLVQRIKPFAKKTAIAGCIGGLGNFGGLYRLKNEKQNFQDPVLILKTGSVRSKLRPSQKLNHHENVGRDLVTVCKDKVISSRGIPLTFLDYYACRKLDVAQAGAVVKGMADACFELGCVLLGGETAEMPGMYADKVYDVAGFILGMIDHEYILPRTSEIVDGDVIIALSLSSVNLSGFSMAHNTVQSPNELFENSKADFDYIDCPFIFSKFIKAIAVPSDNGIVHELQKYIPSHLKATIDFKDLDIPPFYRDIYGRLNNFEIIKNTFNFGVGKLLIVPKSQVDFFIDDFLGHDPRVAGTITTRSDSEASVELKNLEKKMNDQGTKKKRVGVLISGSGSNLQSLIDKSREYSFGMNAEIVGVISNKQNVLGLERAEKAGIKTFFVDPKTVLTREEFDQKVSIILKNLEVDIVCLAGFMRILSADFVKEWQGRLINVHPSLLPKHKGINAQKQALDSGDSRAGCSIHFVDENVDTGATIVQISVPVEDWDDVESLSERILKAEHTAFPRALKWLANEKISLDLETKQVIFKGN